jgi:AcrR family transcriptional regulator
MGTKERREREAARRRREILHAARRLFWKQGYRGTTMPQVARAVELAAGTIYLYFPSKESLYLELLLEGYDVLVDALRRSAATRRKPHTRAEALIDAFFEFARENPEYFDIIFFVLQREGQLWEDSFPPDQLARLRQKEQTAMALVGEVLDQLGGPLARDGQATMAAVWSMLAGTVMYFKQRDEFDRVSAQARRILLTAVTTT